MIRPSGRDVARMLALAAVYAVCSAIALRLGVTLHDSPPLWPASGVAIAALCIGGIRLWPGIALGTLVVIGTRNNGIVLTAMVAVATTLEAVIAVLLLRAVTFRPDLRRARDACALVVAGGVIAPAIGAVIGAGAFAIARDSIAESFLNEWFDWFLGDAMGAIVFAPVLLAWFRAAAPARTGIRIGETTAFAVGLATASLVALGGVPIFGVERPVIFISFPFIVWGALRLGLRTTTSAIALVAVAASVAAFLQVGIFADGVVGAGALLQAYLATAAATALLVASSDAERRDASTRLIESEQRLSLVHEATKDRLALFAVEPGSVFRLTFANGAYLDAVRKCGPGLTEADILGATSAEIAERLGLAPDVTAFYRRKLEDALAAGVPIHVPEHTAVDGTPNDTVLSPVRSDTGRVTHVLWKSHDIGDRVAAQAALRESEARLSLVFNSSSDTLLLFAVEGPDQYRLVMANRSLRDMLQQHRPASAGREIAGMMMSEFITDILGMPTDRVVKNNDMFRRTIATKTPFTYENADWNRDMISEVTIIPVFDATGRCTHVLRSSRDITIRKATQEALRLHDFVVTHAPVGVLMFDGEHRIIFANETACGLLARSHNELIGGSAGELHAASATDWKTLLANAKHRRQYSAEVDRIGADGTRHPLELSIAFLDYTGQEISCVFLRDITERRRAESTRRTLEAELFQAQKMEAIGTLAGGIAHDFNNILAAIVGNAEMAQSDLPFAHPSRQDIAEVLRGARRARDLVRQILTFSRKQESERRPVQLAEVIEDVTRLLRATIPSTIELRKVIDTPDAHVFGDPTQLHQVLMNLCTNSAQAVGDQHGTIEIRQTIISVDADSLRTDLVPGRYVCLAVTDTGHGMDRATLERVFEPFFTTKEPGVGTGLGLAVVHGIIRNHEGIALVESTPGGGTTFRLYFPLLVRAEPFRSAEREEIPLGNGQRVLFVDDEPALTNVTRRMLERLGYNVVALRSATEALTAFRADPLAFDLVISDLTMPGLTGAQLAVELRRVRANMPVILSTGYLDRLDAETAGSLQVRELLLKPYTTEALAAAVHRALTDAA